MEREEEWVLGWGVGGSKKCSAIRVVRTKF